MLEYFEPLILELRQGIHVYEEPVEVLEETLHPLDHDLMILPPFAEGFQKVLARELIEMREHLLFQVDSDGCAIVIVELLLYLIGLRDAQVVDDPAGQNRGQ